MFLNTKVVDEVIEGEVGGVIVKVTKRHIVTVPVEIDIDLATGKANVTTFHADVSCLITSDVIGLAPEEEPEEDEPVNTFVPGLSNGYTPEVDSLLKCLDAFLPRYPFLRDYATNPSPVGKYPMISGGQCW